MKKLLKQIFCNHSSQRCLTIFNMKYIDDYISGKRNRRIIWVCERCGKKIKKRIDDTGIYHFN